MNRNTYTFEERFLAWLFQLEAPNAGSCDASNPWILGDVSGTDTVQGNDPIYQALQGEGWIEASAVDPSAMHHSGERIPRSSGHEPLKLGARSVVQERFYTLLKQRFQREMEPSPPLFPWETELKEYEDVVTSPSPLAVWGPQLRQLRLPLALPVDILETLFQRCQSLSRTTLQEGRRLVEVVESLFPGEAPALNQLAGTLLLGPARGDGQALADRLLASDLPESYEVAPQQQQMTLAMLAVQEMLNQLTLKLTDHDPSTTRTWQTEVGCLELKAEKQGNLLRVEAVLPAAGWIVVHQGQSRIQSEREQAGLATVIVDNVGADVVYQVEVSLAGTEASLGFSVQL